MSSPSETVIPSEESRKMSEYQAILMTLPPEIILDILSRLPIRTIVICKCVCRQLLQLITSPAFAELHLPRSTPGIIIQQAKGFWCKLLEFEDDEEVQNHVLNHKQLMEFDPGDIINNPFDSIRIVGSVSGLLCLVENGFFNEFYICNPVTREYIALPAPEEFLLPFMVTVCGFGVSSSSGEYKVVRISHDGLDSYPEILPDLKCEIYTLGTGSWRRITAGIKFNLSSYPAHVFLSGSLHWLVGDAEGYWFIACFNLETELFNSFPRILFTVPASEGRAVLSILGDCLCVCDYYGNEFFIWAMEDYGVGKSWTKKYVISNQIEDLESMGNDVYRPLKLIVYDVIRDLKLFTVAELLFIWEEAGIFCFSIKTETVAHVQFFGGGWMAEMLHTPSLLSPKRFGKENVKRFGKENVASLGY